MNKNSVSNRILALLPLLMMVTLSACSWQFGTENLNSPSGVVKRLYQAIERKDMNAYLTTLVPEARAQPSLNLFGLLDALSLGQNGVGFNLSALTKFAFVDLIAQSVSQQDNAALVQIRGRIRLTGIIVMEAHFCDEQNVRLVESQWLVDPFAPERTERLRRIAAIQQQKLAALEQDTSRPVQLLDQRVFEITLDMCEH